MARGLLKRSDLNRVTARSVAALAVLVGVALGFVWGHSAVGTPKGGGLRVHKMFVGHVDYVQGHSVCVTPTSGGEQVCSAFVSLDPITNGQKVRVSDVGVPQGNSQSYTLLTLVSLRSDKLAADE